MPISPILLHRSPILHSPMTRQQLGGVHTAMRAANVHVVRLHRLPNVVLQNDVFGSDWWMFQNLLSSLPTQNPEGMSLCDLDVGGCHPPVESRKCSIRKRHSCQGREVSGGPCSPQLEPLSLTRICSRNIHHLFVRALTDRSDADIILRSRVLGHNSVSMG